MNTNASVIIGGIVAALNLLIVFGVHITGPQLDAIKAFLPFLVALAPLVAAFIIRAFVFSRATVATMTGKSIAEVKAIK